MKTLLLALTLFLVLTAPVLAQEPTAEPTAEATTEPIAGPVVPPPFPVEIPETLPETANDIVGWLVAAASLLAGFLGTKSTEFIRSLPFLKQGEKETISGGWAFFLSGLVSVGIGYLISLGGVAANFLDSSGVWAILMAVWPVAYAFYKKQSGVANGEVHTMGQ